MISTLAPRHRKGRSRLDRPVAQIRKICQMERIGVCDGKTFLTTKIGVERIFLFTAMQATYPLKETEMFPHGQLINGIQPEDDK
jgi:hypothetical protein